MKAFPWRVAGIAIVAASLVAAGGGLTRPLMRAGASFIVTAPNRGAAAPVPTAGELAISVGPPNATLSLRTVPPGGDRSAPLGTVFLLHGIRDRSDSLEGWASMLASHGYRAVLVDLRGHGRSTGDYLSYGVVESRDLAQVLDALAAQGLAHAPYGVMGLSYGAAVAIEWAGSDRRISAVVAVAPFASLRSVIAPGYVPSFLPDSFVQGAVDEAGKMGGFDPDLASPAAAITKTRAPVLIIHSRDDTKIPVRHAERIAAAAPDHSELVIVTGMDHNEMVGDRDGTIATRAPRWFEAHLSSEPRHSDLGP